MQAVAQILKTEGVKWVGCFPSNNLIEEVAKVGIRPIMFRHERGALMAASGYSLLNDRKEFGVVITQNGPGAENSMGGLAQAFGDNIPILYLPAGVKLEERSVRPNFSPARTYKTVSKSSEVIYTADSASAVMRRAFHALRNGRPGPVTVELPSDVGLQELDESSFSYQPPKRSPQQPSSGDIKDAVRLLLAAKKPMIWSGMGTLLGGATAELKELAELTGIPVFCTMQGKSGFDERHPLSLASGSMTAGLHTRNWIASCDVILALGSSLTRTIFGQQIPEGKTIIHNTESIEDLNKDFDVDVGIPGDVKLTIQALIEEVKAQIGENGRETNPEFTAEIADTKKKWLAEWSVKLSSGETPINTYRVIGEIERVLEHDNSIVTHDAGAPRDTLMPFYTATVPHTYIGWGKTTHLGYGIPLMIGAKLAMPDRFCLNFMGDGAFGMSGLDIETAVRAGAPITTVVLDNGGMATYPGGYPTAREQFGTTLMTGDYAKIAEGMGAVGITVTDPNEVAVALRQAQQLNSEGKTVLLDIHTNLEAARSR